MTDTPETLQSALDDLTRRVAAFEKAQAQTADVEPRQLRDDEWEMLEKQYHRNIPNTMNMMQCNAAARLRWCEAELARLLDGLKVQDSDIPSLELESWGNDNDFEYSLESMRSYIRSQCRMMAREIQRHRKLVAK